MATGVSESTFGFKYTETDRGISATRVFFYNPDSTIAGPDFPKVGDEFYTTLDVAYGLTAYNYTGVYCRQIDWDYLGGHPNKYQMTASYSNEPMDSSVFTSLSKTATDMDNLPTTIEYSGEYSTLNFTKDNAVTAGWTWKNAKTVVAQPLAFRVNSSTIKISRYVKDENMQSFQATHASLAGKVNNNTFRGYGKGCVLYTGCSTEMFKNSGNTRYWKVDLEFASRNPDGTNYDGWQLQLMMTGFWDTPIRSDGKARYEEGDFSNLFK